MPTQPAAPTRPAFAPTPDDATVAFHEPSYRDDPARPTPADFNPPANIADQVLEDAANPNLPFLAIAQKAGVTLSTLRRWLARPEISQQLDDIESTLRRRARLKVLHELDNITETCATIMERYYRAPDRGSTEDRRPDTELRASNIITRNASNALMASRVMLALAKYLDGPPRSQRRAPAHSDPLPTPSPNPNRPASAPTPALDPALRLTPTELTKAFRLLPSLASVDLHDFREYLTSTNELDTSAFRAPAVTPRAQLSTSPECPNTNPAAFRAPAVTPRAPLHPNPQANHNRAPLAPPQELPAHTSPPLQPEVLTRNSRRQSEVGRRPTSAAHGNASTTTPTRTASEQEPRVPAPARGGTTTRTPCACGPTNCPGCPSASPLLTIAGTQTPRARDPTAPMR